MNSIKQTSEANLRLENIIHQIKGNLKFLQEKSLVIIIVIILGVVSGLLISLIKQPQYIGTLTFILEEGNSGGMGQMAAMGGESGIGFEGPAGVGMGAFSNNNIMKFLKSRLIFEKTLLSSIPAGNATLTLADLYIDVNKISNQQKDQSVRFPAGQLKSTLTQAQDSVITLLWNRITSSELEVERLNKNSGFIIVSFKSSNEILSKEFVEKLVDEVSRFYIDSKTSSARKNVELLQRRADSIAHLLNRRTFSIAEMHDANINPIRKVANVKSELSARDKSILQSIYVESMGQLETAKRALNQEIPLIQVIDKPIFPLEVVKIGKMEAMIIGGILAGSLICSFLLLQKTLREILAQP